jgi:hypothetical protein
MKIFHGLESVSKIVTVVGEKVKILKQINFDIE